MKIYYDPEVDALYFEFCKVEPGTVEARDLVENITANYKIDGKIAGIELLDASEILGEELNKINIEVSPIHSNTKAA